MNCKPKLNICNSMDLFGLRLYRKTAIVMIHLSIFLWVQVYKPTLDRFSAAGGLIGNTPAEVSKGNLSRSEVLFSSVHPYYGYFPNI